MEAAAMEREKKKPSKRKPRTEHTRNLDVEKKRKNREQAKALQSKLWDLTAKAQKRGTPGCVSQRDSLQALLGVTVDLVKRIRQRTVHALKVATEHVQEGLMGSTTLGVMYVCVDDWTVQCSSQAMELVCPLEIIRGYVGQNLCLLVHPDDHDQLAMFQEQARSYSEEDTTPLVLSVRLLRACQDGGTMVCKFQRLVLEVAHITQDKERGGKLHALFTCVVDPAALLPLRFDDNERMRFQVNANAVSGCMAIDCPRTTENLVTMSAILRDEGVNCHNDSHMSEFLSGVSERFRGAFGFSEMVTWVRNIAMSALSGVVRTHLLFGIAPDGVPWVQKSAALQAFGLVSGFRTYVKTAMSGKSVNPDATARNGTFGVLLTPDPTEVGFVSLAFLNQGVGEAQQRNLWLVHRGSWSHGGAFVTGQDEILIANKGEVRPRRYVTNSTRIAPPLQHLVEEFCTFGDRVVTIPIGLQGLEDQQQPSANQH